MPMLIGRFKERVHHPVQQRHNHLAGQNQTEQKTPAPLGQLIWSRVDCLRVRVLVRRHISRRELVQGSATLARGS